MSGSPEDEAQISIVIAIQQLRDLLANRILLRIDSQPTQRSQQCKLFRGLGALSEFTQRVDTRGEHFNPRFFQAFDVLLAITLFGLRGQHDQHSTAHFELLELLADQLTMLGQL